MQKNKITRRDFVKATAGSMVAFSVVPAHVLANNGTAAPSDRLNIAVVGLGRGIDDIAMLSGSENVPGAENNIVAVCDCDTRRFGRMSDSRLAHVHRQSVQPRQYQDYRRMLEKEKDIDAVIIGTPDHSHAVIAMAAMELGKHVYVQKPLTHSIAEARKLQQTAKKYNLTSQMGNQLRSQEGIRITKEWIQAGVIGDVHEIHCWTDRPAWPQQIGRPSGSHPAPEEVDWDLWVGPAAMRPYSSAYHEFRWRGWLDFGTGALGDMGCHILDSPFWALDLGHPDSVYASFSRYLQNDEYDKWKSETFPLSAIVHYTFGSRGDKPPIKLHWYDGGMLPPRQGMSLNRRLPAQGTIYVGDKGVMMTTGEAGAPRLVPDSKMRDFQPPSKSLPRIVGNHIENWIRACKGLDTACSNFEYSGPLTEIVLLGTLALRPEANRQPIEWDGENMKVLNNAELDQFVHSTYRQGWEI